MKIKQIIESFKQMSSMQFFQEYLPVVVSNVEGKEEAFFRTKLGKAIILEVAKRRELKHCTIAHLYDYTMSTLYFTAAIGIILIYVAYMMLFSYLWVGEKNTLRHHARLFIIAALLFGGLFDYYGCPHWVNVIMIVQGVFGVCAIWFKQLNIGGYDVINNTWLSEEHKEVMMARNPFDIQYWSKWLPCHYKHYNFSDTDLITMGLFISEEDMEFTRKYKRGEI
jgi:hypothetical protein